MCSLIFADKSMFLSSVMKNSNWNAIHGHSESNSHQMNLHSYIHIFHERSPCQYLFCDTLYISYLYFIREIFIIELV